MKSNKTRLIALLSIPILFAVFIMAKKETSPITFRPNTKPQSLSDLSVPDTFSMEKIPYMDLMRMIAKYRDERQEVINFHYSGTGSGQYGENFEDSRYFYISLATLEGFINHIRRQVQLNHLNVEFSGVRIYPIVYPNSGSNAYFSSIPSLYRNHTSIAFTPTYMSESGYAVDFDPDLYTSNPNGPGNIPLNLEMQDTQTVASFLTATFGSSTGGAVSVQDHVWLCPPPKCVAAGLSNADLICPDNTCPY
jgi:hypothetical protein